MTENDALRALWHTRPAPPPIDLDQVRRAARRTARRVRFRNVGEWAASVVLVPGFLFVAMRPGLPWLSRVASVCISLAAVVISVWTWRYGRMRALPNPDESTSVFMRAYIDQVYRQAEFLRTTPRWYFGPLAVGVLLFYLGFLLERPDVWAGSLLRLAATMALFGVLLVANLTVANHLRGQAQALEDAFDEEG
ncbi:MAG: hypothetical protein AAGN82_11900 [Myxococcota bacterium]